MKKKSKLNPRQKQDIKLMLASIGSFCSVIVGVKLVEAMFKIVRLPTNTTLMETMQTNKYIFVLITVLITIFVIWYVLMNFICEYGGKLVDYIIKTIKNDK